MKKKLLLIVALVSMFYTRAQVLLTPQLPPLGLTVKSQLWNLSLVNQGAAGTQVKIEISLTDVATSETVLTGSSRMLVLPAGVTQVRLADAMPVVYSVRSPGYGVDPNPNGFLPVGVFTICYTVIKVNSDAPEVLAEECETTEVEPLSPPQLILPLDNEDIGITRPVFAWLPPFPFNTYNSLAYDWILVEVQPTQSAADAIQQNIPVLTRQNVRTTNVQYPLAMPELDTGKTYAWRITAKNNTSPIANSEVWSFRVKQYETDSVTGTPEGFFARLYREEDAAFIICNGVLRFEYMNDNNSSAANLTIFELSSPTRRKVPLDSTAHRVVFGQNFVQVDLRENNVMTTGHMYLLELRNAKNEAWYLKFEFRKPEQTEGQ